MVRLARRMTYFNAEAVNNGLDWLTRQQPLFRADRTPSDIIHCGDAFGVRHYVSPGGSHTGKTSAARSDTCPTPVVLVPPLAVRFSIYDLLPERSFVRYLQARGFEVYLVDWHNPRRDRDRLGLKDYALDMLPEALRAIRYHSGCRAVSLVGYCMGGLFTLLHAGTGLDNGIANIVTIATPVDMHDSTFAAAVPRALKEPVDGIRRRTPLRLHGLDPRLFHVPGRLNALAFKLSSPASGLLALRKLLTNLDDRDKVAAHNTTRDWLNDMRDYPGALVQDIIARVWINNELARGPLSLDGMETDLARIDCPVLAVAGESDTVVGQASTRSLLDRIASRDKVHIVAPGGHFGVIAGSGAPAYCWPRIADWLTSRPGSLSSGAA